jgi:hypothetical protein
MTQTIYTPPDWGALLNQIDADMVTQGAPSDVFSYSIAGRSFTKSRSQLVEYRDFVMGEYLRAVYGGTTIADMSS